MAESLDPKLAKLLTEQQAFDAALGKLLPEHAGQWVLFEGGVSRGFYPTHDAAYRAGLASYGVSGVFLVSEVRKRSPETPSIAWSVGVMFGHG